MFSFFSRSIGYREFVQCLESGPVTAIGQGRQETGQILGIRCRHVDPAAVLLYASGSLVGVHLVFHR